MNLLHRYLFREVLFATVVAVAMFAFVLLGGNVVKDLVGRMASGQIAVEQAGSMIFGIFLFVLPYALPFGLLTAVLLVLGRVSAQHEITAMRSSGLGLTRIAAPVMMIAVLGVACSLVINYVYAPRAKSRYREILFEVGQQKPVQLIIPGTFVRDFPGVVVFASEREGELLRDVWLWLLDDRHRVTTFVWIETAEVRVGVNPAGNETIALFSQGRVRGERRDPDNPEDFSKPPTPVFFDTGPVWEAELADVFKRKVFEQRVAWMDFGELVAERNRLLATTSPEDRQRLLDVKMSLHEKGSMAFSVLSFAFVAVPLGIQTRRKETSANLGLALALILAFYAGIIAVGWLDQRADLRPEILLWIPNLCFQALGGWMWWRFGRN